MIVQYPEYCNVQVREVSQKNESLWRDDLDVQFTSACVNKQRLDMEQNCTNCHIFQIVINFNTRTRWVQLQLWPSEELVYVKN